jgi:hypothetical protein
MKRLDLLLKYVRDSKMGRIYAPRQQGNFDPYKKTACPTDTPFFVLCAESLLLRRLCALRQNFVQTLFHILFARTVYA